MIRAPKTVPIAVTIVKKAASPPVTSGTVDADWGRTRPVDHLLGHSSIAFTMTVYQHVMPDMQAEAAFGAAVFGE